VNDGLGREKEDESDASASGPVVVGRGAGGEGHAAAAQHRVVEYRDVTLRMCGARGVEVGGLGLGYRCRV